MTTGREFAAVPLDAIIYCDICSLPPEYCAYRGTLSRCKEWLQTTHADLYGSLYSGTESEQTAISAKGLRKLLPKDDSAKLERKQEEAAEKRRQAKIIVKTDRRKGKKCVTIVIGLDVFGVENKKAAKLLAQKYATGVSVGKSAEGKEEVVIQGNFEDLVLDFLRESFPGLPQEN